MTFARSALIDCCCSTSRAAGTACPPFLAGPAAVLKSVPSVAWPLVTGAAMVGTPALPAFLLWLRGGCTVGGMTQSEFRSLLAVVDARGKYRTSVMAIPVAGPAIMQALDTLGTGAPYAWLRTMAGYAAPPPRSPSGANKRGPISNKPEEYRQGEDESGGVSPSTAGNGALVAGAAGLALLFFLRR